MIKIIINFLLLFPLGLGYVQASTFVGNGGNASDLELATVLASLKESLSSLTGEEKSALCTCDNMAYDHPLCHVLDNLGEKKKQFCQNFIYQHKNSLATLARLDGAIKFKWDRSRNLKVNVGKDIEEVSAVTMADQKIVILNENDFLAAPFLNRIALVSHELIHLLNDNGQFIGDLGGIGPFSGNYGKKDFLTVVGAAIAIHVKESGSMESYYSLKTISRAYDHIWININSVTGQMSKGINKKFLLKGALTGSEFDVAYWRYNLGLILGGSSVKSQPGHEDITSQLKYDDLKGGVGYRIFPINSPLTRWSQFFMVFSAQALFGTYKHTLDDGYVREDDKVNVYGGEIGWQNFFPLANGFWLIIGGSIKIHTPCKLDTVNSFIDQPIPSLILGASYAF